MSLLIELSTLIEENKVKAYKIPLSDAQDKISKDDLWKWVEEQEVVTIEDVHKHGGMVYVFPHFSDKYSEDTLKKLKRSLTIFISHLEESVEVVESHFEDDQVDLEADAFEHGTLADYCKEKGIKVEKRGAHNLIRFSGDKKALRDMIHSFWGEPEEHETKITEARSLTQQEYKNLAEVNTDFSEMSRHVTAIMHILQSPAMAHHAADLMKKSSVDLKPGIRALVSALDKVHDAISDLHAKADKDTK